MKTFAASERQNCHRTYIHYESKEEVVTLLRIVANSKLSEMMNNNHHQEAILSMRRWTNLGKKRKDGQNRVRKWHMRVYPFSTPSRTSRVFTRLIFFFV